MVHLRSWPPALLRRWLLQFVTGLGCLTAGLIMFLAARDVILLAISAVLSAWICLRCIALYWLVRKNRYEITEGICVDIKTAPLQKQRVICLRTDTGREQTLSLDKQARVEIGNRYRVYLRQQSSSQEPVLALEFLGRTQSTEK